MINGAHWHLIVNHVSLFAMVIGTVAFAASMKRNSVDLRILATTLFLVAGVFGWIAVETGEKAAEVVMALGGESKSFIIEHGLAATWAQRSGIFVAALAIAMEWAYRKKQNWFKPLRWALLIFAIHGCTVFARTVYLGGLIRHTEIRTESLH